MTPSHEASASYRWVGVAGLVLVASLILSFLIPFGAPEAIRDDATILDWYSNATNQMRFVIASVIAGIGVMAFLVFLVGFRRQLAAADGDETLVEVAYAAGLIVVALAMVEVAIGSSVAGTLMFSDKFRLDPETARIVLTIGNIWMPAVSGIPSALFMGSASIASRRAAFLPGWLTWIGFVLAALSLLVVPGFGANGYLVVVWILLVSIVLLRRADAHQPADANAA